MKTAVKMKEEGFTEISTVECLLREMQVRKISQTVFDPLRQPTSNQYNADDASKKRKIDENDDQESEAVDEKPTQKVDENQKNFVTAIPLLKMPSHTGFLTFATLPPNREV